MPWRRPTRPIGAQWRCLIEEDLLALPILSIFVSRIICVSISAYLMMSLAGSHAVVTSREAVGVRSFKLRRSEIDPPPLTALDLHRRRLRRLPIGMRRRHVRPRVQGLVVPVLHRGGKGARVRPRALPRPHAVVVRFAGGVRGCAPARVVRVNPRHDLLRAERSSARSVWLC